MEIKKKLRKKYKYIRTNHLSEFEVGKMPVFFWVIIWYYGILKLLYN